MSETSIHERLVELREKVLHKTYGRSTTLELIDILADVFKPTPSPTPEQVEELRKAFEKAHSGPVQILPKAHSAAPIDV